MVVGSSWAFRPSDVLEEDDDVLELLGALALVVVLMGTYHYNLSKKLTFVDLTVSEDDGTPRKWDDKSLGFIGRSTSEITHWDLIGAEDLREGSHSRTVTRWTLLAVRAAAVVYCLTIWIVLFVDRGCCRSFIFLEAWFFVLFTLYFTLGLVLSSEILGERYGPLNTLEKSFVRLFEAIFPLTLFLFWTYWLLLDPQGEMIFPGGHHATNRTFTMLNTMFILAEWALNRIVLNSQRWMWFTYFICAYGFVMLIIEKLGGRGYLVYREIDFLPLDVASYPLMMAAIIALYVAHFAACFLVTIRQHFWTTELQCVRSEPTPQEEQHEARAPLLVAQDTETFQSILD